MLNMKFVQIIYDAKQNYLHIELLNNYYSKVVAKLFILFIFCYLITGRYAES